LSFNAYLHSFQNVDEPNAFHPSLGSPDLVNPFEKPTLHHWAFLT